MSHNQPTHAVGEAGDKMEALRLGRQLHHVLPRRAATVLGDELHWLAERTNLTGRQRYLDLRAELKEIVETLPIRPRTAA